MSILFVYKDLVYSSLELAFGHLHFSSAPLIPETANPTHIHIHNYPADTAAHVKSDESESLIKERRTAYQAVKYLNKSIWI